MRKCDKRLSKHHRKPRSIGGENEERNISRVSTLEHRAWHSLFHNFTPEKICEIINEVWIDPDYEVLCRKKDK